MFPNESYSSAVILEIVKYGHPVLRQKGERIKSVTPEIRQVAADMIETMYANNGVGLAAQQIGRAIMLTVIDVSPSDIPWSMTPQLPMPMPLLNPVLTNLEGEQCGSEGCLSFPEINADIRRAESLTLTAMNLDGNEIRFDCTGLLARAIQHEIDHLNGILFADRMSAASRVSLAGRLKKLQKETQAALGQTTPRRRSLARL